MNSHDETRSALVNVGVVAADTQLRQAAMEELGKVLDSPAFRGSKRGQVLLRYLIEHGLAGDLERLKERTIGIEIFGRDAGYDTGQDAIVRVAANDVRKRLGEHYERSTEQPIRIFLTPGSYVPAFQIEESRGRDASEAAASTGSATGGRLKRASSALRRPRLLAAALGLAAAGLALYFGYLRPRANDVLTGFWAPMLKSQKRVLICVAQPLAYRFPNQPTADRVEGAPALAPGDRPIPMRDAYVGVGDAFVLADISAFLARHGVKSQRRAGTDASSADLRENPVVLIGAFSNPWTRKLTQNLRFVFGDGLVIHDRVQSGRQWGVPLLTPDWKTPEDYAIISRFSSGETGEPVLVVAGLTNYGTQAAGEFITDASVMESATRQLPAGWQQRNVQFVIHTKIIGKTPARPTLIASHVW